ncbi:hypothetical protein ACEZDB_26270 [Streptacidiphilus sp. N1-3]|uniref:Uncharacterized protein n=1 Tax=Streptacidiphilus alkalitolerans TaxID=3342712 RepID=A0ABV6X795_9ACTN
MNADSSTEGPSGAGLAQDLSDLAYSMEISPTPYQDVLRGGRRRRRQRRVLLAAAGTVAAAAVLGGTLGVDLSAGPARGVTVAVAPSAPAAGHSAGTAAGTPSTPPARDPMKPVTVLLAQGTSGGKTWKAWADLWPAVDQQHALQQLQAMYTVRHAAIPQLPSATQSDADRSWQPDTDTVDLYLTLDGKRLVDDSVHTSPAPGSTTLTSTRQISGDSLEGTLLGFKGGEMGSTPVLLAAVGSDAAKVVVTWQDGSTSHPAVVTAGSSPVRWFSVARKPGQSDRSIKVYDAHGKLLLTDTTWFH